MSCVEASCLTSRLASVRNQYSLLFDACTYIELCTATYQDISLLKDLCAIFEPAVVVICELEGSVTDGPENYTGAYTMKGEEPKRVSTPWITKKLGTEKAEELYRFHSQITALENQECPFRKGIRSSLVKRVHRLFSYSSDAETSALMIM